MRTPSLPSSRIGASAACAFSAATRSSSTKPRNESPPPASYCARQLRDVQHVGQRLLAARCAARSRRAPASRRAGPGSFRPPAGSCGGDADAAARAALSAIGCEVRGNAIAGTPEADAGAGTGARRVEALLPLEQLLVADRKQRPAQRREHRQLIVRPLDRGQRGADGFDFFAIVEGLAADEHVADAARLERADVRLRDVLAEADEAPEQDADVLRGDGGPDRRTGAR